MLSIHASYLVCIARCLKQVLLCSYDVITFKYADTHNIYFLFKIVDMALVHLVRYRIGGMY